MKNSKISFIFFIFYNFIEINAQSVCDLCRPLLSIPQDKYDSYSEEQTFLFIKAVQEAEARGSSTNNSEGTFRGFGASTESEKTEYNRIKNENITDYKKVDKNYLSASWTNALLLQTYSHCIDQCSKSIIESRINVSKTGIVKIDNVNYTIDVEIIGKGDLDRESLRFKDFTVYNLININSKFKKGAKIPNNAPIVSTLKFDDRCSPAYYSFQLHNMPNPIRVDIKPLVFSPDKIDIIKFPNKTYSLKINNQIGTGGFSDFTSNLYFNGSIDFYVDNNVVFARSQGSLYDGGTVHFWKGKTQDTVYVPPMGYSVMLENSRSYQMTSGTGEFDKGGEFRGLLVTPNFDRDLSYDQIAPLGKFRLIVKNNGLSQVNYNLDNNLIKVLLFKKCSTIK